MKGSKHNNTCIEERVVNTAEYMIETKSTVRQTAKKFGVSKSTVHTDVHKPNDMKRSLRLPRKPVFWNSIWQY